MFKQIILTINLIGLLTHSASATNTGFDFKVSKVAENVYSIIAPSYGRPSPENKGWNSNSHFVVTETGVLVFDTGSSESIGMEITRAITTVTDLPIRWVVNSHSHADHWLGNAAFSNVGAEVISTAPSVAAMKEDGQGVVDVFSRMTKGATGSSQLSFPTSLIAQRQTRNVGGVDIEFILSGDGHSPGDVLMWLPKQKIIFGGDVLSSDWMPIMTPRGKVRNLIDTINMVIKLKPDVVLTGHGQITTMKSVIRDSNFLETVWNLVKLGHVAGKNPESILLQVNTNLGSQYRPLYKDFDSNSEYLVQMMYKKISVK